MSDADLRYESFIGRFIPGVAAIGRNAVRRLRARLPGCDALVYDDYAALAVGFSPDGTREGIFLSIALYPRRVRLIFIDGAALPDPDRLLQGAEGAVRYLVLASANDLDQSGVRALVDAAEERAGAASAADGGPREGRLVIRSVSSEQRPRRP